MISQSMMEHYQLIGLLLFLSFIDLQLAIDKLTMEDQPSDNNTSFTTTITTTINTSTTTITATTQLSTVFSIESVVVPEAGLRVWHITAIVIAVIVTATVITCCCIDIRIPRSAQQIEETYRKRKLNQQYIKELTRVTPHNTTAPLGHRREIER